MRFTKQLASTTFYKHQEKLVAKSLFHQSFDQNGRLFSRAMVFRFSLKQKASLLSRYQVIYATVVFQSFLHSDEKFDPIHY